MEHRLHTIAWVRGGREERGDDGWATVASTIELDTRFAKAALAGLHDFSHVEVVFRFHTLEDEDVVTDARHPRSNPDWPLVGILAQRGSKRPNRLGVSVCELVEVRGRELLVRGLDAIDGSPVLDVKPVMTEFLPRGEVRQPPWSTELMAGYWHGPATADDEVAGRPPRR